VSEPIRRIKAPVRLEYTVRAGWDQTRFLQAIVEGRIVGRRCPGCHKVYVPPRGGCPTCGVSLGEEVPVKDTGIVTSFCIVNVPFEGQQIELPYVYAWILLDGAGIAFPHILQGIKAAEARMGLRVKADWVPPEERKPTLESIRSFRPTGEPDAPFDSYKEHL
jgi:uncharacterized OB-fold protein